MTYFRALGLLLSDWMIAWGDGQWGDRISWAAALDFSRRLKGAGLALLLAFAAAATAGATNYTLTLSTTGPKSPSVVFSSNPTTGINCGGSSTACSASFASSATVNLTAVTGSTVVFAGWTYARGCANNFTTCAVKMTAATAVVASYSPVLALSLNGNGLGVVTSSPAAVNCSWTNGCARGVAAKYSFKPGSTVVLVASTGAYSSFIGWTGSGSCGTASTCTVTMSSYTVIVATFNSSGPFNLAVSLPFAGGVVTSSPTGISCSSACAVGFSSGTSIALSTRALSGYYFGGWQNGGCTGKTSPCVVVSSSAQQGLGGAQSPAAFFFRQ